MPEKFEHKLNALGIVLPAPPPPAANYVPWVKTGPLVFISGQISADENGFILGKLGEDIDVEKGQRAARACAIALISQLKAACDGDLERLIRVVKLTGFVNSTETFTDQPLVINGASDLIAEVFGKAGAHARAAVSAPSLPLGVAVEIDGVFEIK